MDKKDIKQNYSSPRWSMEIVDCSMPMSMDTYSKCAYNCLYCFAFFQKSHTLKGYTGKNGDPVGVRSVNPKKVIDLFEKAFRNDQSASDSEKQFFPYIQSRRIMQWGGLADEFDEWERRLGVTLELLQYFDKIDYPLSFSTKSALSRRTRQRQKQWKKAYQARKRDWRRLDGLQTQEYTSRCGCGLTS